MTTNINKYVNKYNVNKYEYKAKEKISRFPATIYTECKLNNRNIFIIAVLAFTFPCEQLRNHC